MILISGYRWNANACRAGALLLLLGQVLFAQNIAGNWQGTLRVGSKQVRIVVEIGEKALIHSPDQITEVIAADSFALKGSNFTLVAQPIGVTFQGKISADRTSITGTWSGHDPDFLGTEDMPVPLDLHRATRKTVWQIDPTPHRTRSIAVDKGVHLEVLDWGGSGRPLVLLAGGGNTAHIFDKFAMKLAASYHVFGVTRRGFGASSAPAPTRANYAADRLGDDVLAVIDALHLDKPILVGHSLAGEELSSIGSRHSEKVAALIYLEAAYHWAYYDSAHRDPIVDRNESQSRDQKTVFPSIGLAMQAGMQKYTEIHGPILAIYAVPHDRGITDPEARAAADAKDLETSGIPAKAFAAAFPSAKVVILPHADHFVFTSNEADVLRDMNAFISGLP